MSFTTYNQINAPHKPEKHVSGPMTLYMSTYGTFRLSLKAASVLKLKEKDKVEFLQDSAYPTDWYIQQASDKFGFPTSLSNAKGTVTFQSTGMRDMLLKTVIKDTTLRYRSILFVLSPAQGKLAINTTGYKISITRHGK